MPLFLFSFLSLFLNKYCQIKNLELRVKIRFKASQQVLSIIIFLLLKRVKDTSGKSIKSKEKLHTLFLLSAILVLFLILVSSTESVVVTDQNASSTESHAYVTNYYGHTVSVIDTTTIKLQPL